VLAGVDVRVSVRAGHVVVALRGELDVTNAADIICAHIAPHASGLRIVVDLAELPYLDCSSLRELASVRAQARRAGGDLLMASPQQVVLRLLVLTGMLDQWPVFASVDEAVGGGCARLQQVPAGDPWPGTGARPAARG